MLHLLLAIVFSTLKSQVQSHSESIKTNLKHEIVIGSQTRLTVTDITDGSSIVLHATHLALSYRIFAFFYIPDQTISSFLFNNKPVQFKSRDPNFEMFSIDPLKHDCTIEFQFVSKPGGSSYGRADLFVVTSDRCRPESVGEFGSLNKQVNISLPSNFLDLNGGTFSICVFSPHFGLVTGEELFQVGTIVNSSPHDTLVYLTLIIPRGGEIKRVDYYNPNLWFRFNSTYKQYYFHRPTAGAVKSAKTILNRIVTSTSDESFYKNNCVAMSCQTCNATTCIVSSSVNISYQCDEQPSTAPTLTFTPPNSDKSGSNNMGLIIGVVVGGVVVIVVIIVCIVWYRRKQSFEEFRQNSNSQTDLKTPLGTTMPEQANFLDDGCAAV